MRFSAYPAVWPARASARACIRAMVVLCAALGCQLLCSAPALAVGAPEVERESFSDVGSSSARVSAQIDLEGVAGTYYFEYGPTVAYGSSTPVMSAGGAEGAVSVPAQLEGLTPGTTYHFRVVVVGEDGTTRGADDTFTTLPTGILGLPDGRVYEMVTPPENQNADVYEPALGKDERGELGSSTTLKQGDGVATELPSEAAADGEAVAYVGSPTSGGNGNSGGGPEGNEYMATRSPEGGWQQVVIQPPGYPEVAYQAFSSDLSIGILSTRLGESLEPLAEGPPIKHKALYARLTSDGSYHALFTNIGPDSPDQEPETYPYNELLYAGSSSNLEHLLFVANEALTANAEADPPSGEENDLYDSVDGQPHLVNVLPSGATETDAIFGAQAGTPDFSHVISANGSRIFWTDLHPGSNDERIFVRENDIQPQSPLGGKGECLVPADACTVAVSNGSAQFWTATSDGEYVFYIEGDRLYRADIGSGAREQLAANAIAVLGASEQTGEYVYYVDENDHLFLWHEGVSTPIATLSGQDGGKVAPYQGSGVLGETYGRAGDWQPYLARRTAETTPDGKQLVFMSQLGLTGYPNEGLAEVYIYDAETRSLVCASCSRSGEPPQLAAGSTEGDAAGFLPLSFNATYIPRWISEDGSRVFFDSAVSLVPRDTNGERDVYEWERDGTGSCHESPGCQYLLSSGASTSSSFLLDAGATGDDVFIGTRGQLVPQDRSEGFNLFDVRVGGEQPVSAPVCTGSGCQGIPAAPPVFATPASVTFDGVGNYPLSAPPRPKRATRPKKATRGGSAHGRCQRAGKPNRGKCSRASTKRKKHAAKPRTRSEQGRES